MGTFTWLQCYFWFLFLQLPCFYSQSSLVQWSTTYHHLLHELPTSAVAWERRTFGTQQLFYSVQEHTGRFWAFSWSRQITDCIPQDRKESNGDIKHVWREKGNLGGEVLNLERDNLVPHLKSVWFQVNWRISPISVASTEMGLSHTGETGGFLEVK